MPLSSSEFVDLFTTKYLGIHTGSYLQAVDMNGSFGVEKELLRSEDTGEDETEQPAAAVDVDDVLNDIGFGSFQVIAFLLAGLSFFAYGCSATVITFINLPVSKLWHLTSFTYATLSSMNSATNTLGSIVFGFLADRFGRVWPYAFFMSIISLFSLAAAFSPSFPVLLVLRGIVSIGIGGVQAMTYPMLVEFLPVQKRGQTAVLLMLLFALGSTVVAGLAWWLIPTYPDGWRYLIIATCIPPLLAVLLRLIFHYQSPRFLISRSNIPAAWKVLEAMARFNRKTLDRHQPRQLKAEDNNNNLNVCQKCLYIFKPPLLRQTALLMIIKLGARFTFYNTLTFLPNILEDLGVSIYFSLLAASLAQIPGTLLMSIVTEWPWFGRLNTLRLYTLTAATFFFLFAFVRNDITIPVFVVIIYATMSPIVSMSYTYTSESYPTEVRSTAIGILLSTQGVIGIAVPLLAGYIVDLSYSKPWLFPTVWGSVYVIVLVATFGLKHDPRGQVLEDVLKTK